MRELFDKPINRATISRYPSKLNVLEFIKVVGLHENHAFIKQVGHIKLGNDLAKIHIEEWIEIFIEWLGIEQLWHP